MYASSATQTRDIATHNPHAASASDIRPPGEASERRPSSRSACFEELKKLRRAYGLRGPAAGVERGPRFLDDGFHGVADPIEMGSEAEDAQTDHIAPIEARAGEEHAPSGIHAAHQIFVDAIGDRALAPDPESDHRELGLVDDLEAIVGLQARRPIV